MIGVRLGSQAEAYIFCLLGLLCTLLSRNTAAQIDVKGKVVARRTQNPVRAKIEAKDVEGELPPRNTSTDQDGRYVLPSVSFGTYNITAIPLSLYTPITKPQVRVNSNTKDQDFELLDLINVAVVPGQTDSLLIGTVMDPSGDVIPGATIELRETLTNFSRQSKSDNAGQYSFAGLRPGTYELHVEKPGFQTLQFPELKVQAGTGIQLNVPLNVGSVREVVEVTGIPVQLETQTQVISVVNEPSSDLPLHGRNFTQLISLAPGVTGNERSVSDANQASIYQIDTDVAGQSVQAFQASGEKENRTLTPTNMSGLTQQAVIVNKSGDNQLHGEVAYLHRNNALDAANFFSLPDFVTARQHEGSASLGGPIRKDRVFFYTAYDLLREAAAPTFSPVLVARISELNGQLGRLGLPIENLRSRTTSLSDDSPVVRLDASLSSTQRIWVLYSFSRNETGNGFVIERAGTSGLPSAARDFKNEEHFLSMHHTLARARVSNDAQYTFQDDLADLTPVAPNELSLVIPGLAAIGRFTSLTAGDGGINSRHILRDVLIKQLGKSHTLGVGGQVTMENQVLRFPAFESGRAVVRSLDALATPTPITELFQLGHGASRVSSREYLLGLFIEDSWRVTPNVILNLGLRNDMQFPTFLKTQYAFEPRVEIAWSVWRNSVIRAGYNLFRDPLPLFPVNLQLLMGGGLSVDIPCPARTVLSLSGEASAGPALLRFLRGESLPAGPQLAVLYDRNSRESTSNRAFFSVERSLGSHLELEAEYSFLETNDLLGSTNINLPPPTVISGRPDFGNRVLNPAFSQIFEYQTVGSSTYNGLDLIARLNETRGILLNAKYTFSRGIDDVPTGSFEATPENVFNRRAERAVSDLSATHDLRINGTWEFANNWGRDSRYPVRLITHPYLNADLHLRSGQRWNVLTGFDTNHDGNPFTDRPESVPRNTFLGQPFAQLDVCLGFRPYPIKRSERLRMNLSVEAFNVLNRANFTSYNTVLGQATLAGLDPRIVFGRAALPGFDYQQQLAPDGFGLATSAATPRRIQVGLKFEF